MIKAVIFDVDGTLVDSNDLHTEAWQEAFRRYGQILSFEQVHEQIGKGGDQLIPVFLSPEELDKFGRKLERERSELFKKDYLSRVRPFPKVRELFERIKEDGLSIALASSAKEEELKHHKKMLNIDDLVDAMTTADDAERSKPHPDIFQGAVDGLDNVLPEQVIVVGDSPYDVIAAAKVGMRTIGVLSGGFTQQQLRDAGAVEIYDGIADLLDHYGQSLLGNETATAGR